MTLSNGKTGEKIRVKDIKEKNLNTRLLSLGLCKGDDCVIENIANGNILIKTLETKIVISTNLAEKIEIEVLK